MRLIMLVFAAILAVPAGLSAQPSGMTEKQTITVGARVDARPFIWQDKSNQEYIGFFWDICTEAVTRAGYTHEPQEITTTSRKLFLETGEGAFDILCDPTTITLSRMKEFIDLEGENRLRFSPIVFVANGSHIKTTKPTAFVHNNLSDEEKKRCEPVMSGQEKRGVSDSTETKSFWSNLVEKIPIQMLPDKAPTAPEEIYEIWGYIKGTTSEDNIKRAIKEFSGGATICPSSFSKHEDAAHQFCGGRLARYYGDVEIMRAAIEDVTLADGTKCEADFRPTANGSYEPYAFVVSGRRFGSFPEQFDHALYGMFSDGSIERLFVGHFPEKSKSQFLNTLFRINSLPAGSP